MSLPLIKDSKGDPSVTMTAFVLGFIVVCIKLLLSGLTIKGFSFAVFTGVDFSASVCALGGVYVLRRNTDPTNKQDSTNVKP
ncbi:MAG TPA: hypothetical protein VI911_12055 [Patescibacteria group bacterium]|nr:hypothetical protein [Patescibacteria group bacterium]